MYSYNNIFRRLKTASTKFAPDVNHLKGRERHLLNGPTEGGGLFAQPEGSLIQSSEKSLPSEESFVWIKASSKSLHNMDNCHSIGTPLTTKPKLDVDLSGEPIDQSDYHSKIGSLMYLTSSRSDLVQAVCYYARYQARPTQKYLKEVKGIFKYLKSTINIGLGYPKDSGFKLTAFSDADHAGCIDTCKSTYGGIQFLGDKLVSLDVNSNKTALPHVYQQRQEYLSISASYVSN
ncbi:hypothetical protein Tco_0769926 [Tanacetum coccineum]|uniref:Uncharacterized protein n=1 Tax=Tanacetum coccineum TaxID=301880 RepID=A0ABQ4ZBR7_9ASTR